MKTIKKQKHKLNKVKRANKKLDVINIEIQTNPDVTYIINPHSRLNMIKRKITEIDIVKSIEEFDKYYINNDRTIVEKKIGDHVVRTIYSFNIYTKQIFIISTMHINKKKFARVETDSFNLEKFST